MGIDRRYSTAFAHDLMRAYKQGYKKGTLVHSSLGFSLGVVAGCGLTVWVLNRYNEKKKEETKTE